VSYQPRTIYLDRCHELTRQDVLKASPPPDWTAADEQAHARAWSRKHTPNANRSIGEVAQAERLRREASDLPTAEYWREIIKELK